VVDKTHTTKVSDHKTSAPVWQAVVLSIFPEMFPGPLAHSLAGQAHERGIWSLQTVDIRDHSSHKHRSVDDTPFGGGAGMVMRPDVVSQAIEAARQLSSPDMPLIYLTPRGRPLDQQRVRTLAQGDGAIILCGRFEGIDQRVLEAHDVEEVSLGDFVLSGGEIAAQALLDACVRLLPDVIGSEASLEEESFETGLLEYPHYTRPRDWHDRLVPEVLLSGHHANITAWRHEQAITITRERRPDLWHRYAETEHKI
jgi:tRNA (guanine37-N1)-methyltransferase